MPHIHTQPGQYDFTTSALIIRTDFSEPKIFLHKHLLSGKWTQPGGHVELNESPWAAVLHEVTEESGYVVGQLKVLQPKLRLTDVGADATLLPQPMCVMTYSLAAHPDHIHTDMVYVFTAKQAAEQPLRDNESTDVQHFSREEIVELPTNEIPDNVRQAALFALDECLLHWQAVPVAA